MPWSERSAVSLRHEFVQLACLDGANMQDLCERFGISRPTGYKWLRRYQAEGAAGLAERSRRPHSSPRRTPKQVEEAILDMRGEHASWGARKLRKVLLDAQSPPGSLSELTELSELSELAKLPAPSTITQILRRHGRLDPSECSKHKPFQTFEHPHPNSLWQMDFKGHFGLLGGDRCHPLTVLDDHSRFCMLLSACADERAETVQQRLATCFLEFGMPENILCDNGAPWGAAGSSRCNGSHTALSAWLIRLGIHVWHGRPWHPQTQGKEERFHRTLLDELVRPVMGLCVRWNAGANAAKPGADPSQSGKVVNVADHAACQAFFDPWRTMYNQFRPHQGIGMQTPASRYCPSPRPFPRELPPIEYASEPGQVVRKVQNSGEISFQNRMFFIGSAFAGQPVALRQTAQEQLLNVYFCEQRITFIDLKTTHDRRLHDKRTTKPRTLPSECSNKNQSVNDVSEHV